MLEDFENLNEHFIRILSMKEAEFRDEAHEYINAYDTMLVQLQNAPDNHLTSLLTYAKESLLTAVAQTSILQDDKNSWLSEFSKKIEAFKKHAEIKSWEHFNHMKTSVLESVVAHDNTLLVWALGNEGENCDDSSFWQELLSNETILQHSILVYGHDSSLSRRTHQDSNYTKKHADHALGKPFTTFVWDQELGCYVLDRGTSFSAPLVTIDAFNVAQEILSETGQAPLYSDVKSILVKK